LESKWRLNRWLLGFNDDAPGILYARLLGTVFPFWVRSTPPGTPVYTVGTISTEPPGVPDVEQVFGVISTPLKPLGPFQPFPYGLAVEPDHM